jgi:hypothetical protein
MHLSLDARLYDDGKTTLGATISRGFWDQEAGPTVRPPGFLLTLAAWAGDGERILATAIAALEQRLARQKMIANNRNDFQMSSLNAKPAWAEAWHLWTIFIPRRSITGRLLFGQVWRRYDGRPGIYKKFIEFAHDHDGRSTTA